MNAPNGRNDSAVGVQDMQAAPPAADDVRSVNISNVVEEIVRAVRARVSSLRRPQATYRVQFHREFTFRRATELVPYWSALGISHVYASPYLKAAAGSTHGYDIVDHSRLNPEVGSAEDFQAFVRALRTHGMGHLLDFVPNHMGVGTDENPWWQDVLENGQGSRFASFFDIDWNPLKPDLECKVLLPVLGEQFGQVLESGQLILEFHDGAFSVRYFNRHFPIVPRTFERILRHRFDDLAAQMPADDPQFLEYQSILTAISHLPPRSETDPIKLDEGQREKEVVKRRLQRLCDESLVLRDWIRANVEIFNGRAGDPRSFDLLDDLLAQQAYRLSFWRVAADEINYRRFFDINELAALCMERPEVFERSHAFVFQLLSEGQLDGLRIDHADGLYDPTAYLWQIQRTYFLELCRMEFERQYAAAGGQTPNGAVLAALSESLPAGDLPARRPLVWPDVADALGKAYEAVCREEPRSPMSRPLYLAVEKILERNERLPENWPIFGSTGYDFLNEVNGLFIDDANAKAFDLTYARFIGGKMNLAELIYEAKRLIMRASMSSELHVLGHYLDRLSERNRWTRDFTLHGLIQALREVIACFPVYRTYTVGRQVLERDRRYVEQAVARAKRRNPDVSGAVFDFVRSMLLLQGDETLSDDDRRLQQSFVGRFQQYTGPMMAKAVEDTAFYRFNRLVSLNEVGGDPERFGLSVDEFHRHNLERQKQRPWGMLATSTHDTKRSEDVRARINALSEFPLEWRQRVSKWARLNKRKKSRLEGDFAPGRNDEWLLYQTLIGTWPFEPPRGPDLAAYVTRIQDYMTKAVREAKLYSSWIAPNEAYEQALREFIANILADDPVSAFRIDFEPFARQFAQCGLWNSLGQTLLKLASPGVPDIYEGTEIWNLCLVDPDNRQPVDYGLRERQLADLRAGWSGATDRRSWAAELVHSATDGRIKMFVHAIALELRHHCPELFTTGEYLPALAQGTRQKHVCAFIRRASPLAALVVVPRVTGRLAERPGMAPVGPATWNETRLPLPEGLKECGWKNMFTGECCGPAGNNGLALGEILGTFPVALLAATPVDAISRVNMMTVPGANP